MIAASHPWLLHEMGPVGCAHPRGVVEDVQAETARSAVEIRFGRRFFMRRAIDLRIGRFAFSRKRTRACQISTPPDDR